MKRLIRYSLPLSIISLCCSSDISKSQVLPDRTLPTNTTVINSVNQIDISNGTRRGNNLFHSFREFNIPSGNTARFRQSSQIQNIITRVTGGRGSSIDGSLSVDGNSNLFLVNKNGISFGPNARLNLNGSFLGSTANQIVFENGFQYGLQSIKSAKNLPFSNPSQLLFINNQSRIEVSGNGGFVDLRSMPPFIDLRPKALIEGLQTSPGQSLNIVGGNVLLNGGLLSVSQGSLSIGAVISGRVDLKNTSLGTTLAFNESSNYGNVNISNESLINYSESIASIRGDIVDVGSRSLIFGRSITNENNHALNVIANVIRIAETDVFPNQLPTGPNLDLFGSGLTTGLNSQTFGPAQSASISLSATDIELGLNAGITSSSFQGGSGGDIQISAKNIIFTGLPDSFDPLISTNTFGLGNAGAIKIDANNIDLNAGQIVSVSFGPKDSGDINIEADTINIKNGSSINSFTFARSDFFDAGNSGDINIKTKLIRLVGQSPISFTSSAIAASSFGDGNGGQVKIFSEDIIILDGARINSSALANGNSGGIEISANRVFLSGRAPLTGTPSQISSAAELLPPVVRRPLNLPEFVTGNAGNVSIKANLLEVKSGATVSTRNDGSGDGGNLFLDVNSVFVDNGGVIAATSRSGEAGNIRILGNNLFLEDGAISTSAGGDGDGGNIIINTDLIVGFGKNSITANAENAKGGNVFIKALAIFLSDESIITATSERGTEADQGNVDVIAEITDFSQDPNLNIQTDPPDLYSACSPTYRNTLAYYRMGNGGQPISPDDKSSTSQGWLESANARYAQQHLFYIDTETGEKKPLKRVVGWKSHGDGTITFVSDPKEADQYPAAIAAAKNTCSTEQANNG